MLLFILQFVLAKRAKRKETLRTAIPMYTRIPIENKLKILVRLV